MAMTTGIRTEYESASFRSRLEARWAAFFDLIGWRWTYEPLDAEGYIPDFLIHGQRPFFVEVGPCVTLEDYRAKAVKASTAGLERDVIVVGISASADLDSHYEYVSAGWHGEWIVGEYAWAVGLWGQCFVCGAIGVVHSEMTYNLRPCGHHQSGGFGRAIDVEHLWRQAGNATQWRP